MKLKPADQSDIEALLPLVKEYHEFEGVRLSDEARIDLISKLLGNNSYGKVWLICIRDKLVEYIALCFGFSIEFGARDTFVDETLSWNHFAVGAGVA